MAHDRERGHATRLERLLAPSEAQAGVPARRLLDALDAVFARDPRVDELGVVVAAEGRDAASAFVTPAPHKLGIASWALKGLFRAAKARFDRLQKQQQTAAAAAKTAAAKTAAAKTAAAMTTLPAVAAAVAVPSSGGDAESGSGAAAGMQTAAAAAKTAAKTAAAMTTLPAVAAAAAAAAAAAVPSSGGDAESGSGAAAPPSPEQMLRAARALLLLHPSSYSAWNARKQARCARRRRQQRGGAEEIVRELAFVDLVFSKHPKIAEAWEHRKWCVRELVRDVGADADAPRSSSPRNDDAVDARANAHGTLPLSALLSHEIDMCELVARRYPKNYYAWSHRQFVCVHFESRARLVSELHRSQQWCERNVSDHSGFQHRQFLWTLLLEWRPMIAVANTNGAPGDAL